MRVRTKVGMASAAAIAVGSIYYLRQNDGDITPPTMTREGEAVQTGLVFKRRTVDYETVVHEALTERLSLITVTLKGDRVRDQHIEGSIRYSPFPTSRARVRVKYHVEYSFGFPLEPGDFSVAREDGDLLVTVRRPRMVAKPSVKLLAYEVLESGILVDERTAIIELQRRIQPEAERRGRELAARPSVATSSERALRRFLTSVLTGAGEGAEPPPRLVIRYR